MSFFTNLRADRLVTEIRSATDPASPATQKTIAKLRDLGPGAIEPVFAALPEADKNATVAFVEVLTGLVSQKTFPQFIEGLVQGSPRVVAGIAWALTSNRNYPPHLLLEALGTAGVSKSAILEVIAAQKSRFGVRDLLTAAYAQEPNEKAALFRIIGEIADDHAVAELLGRVNGKDPIARVHIINILARFNTPEVQTALQGLLKDPNKLIRGAALSALQRMDGQIDVERVCALLKDPRDRRSKQGDRRRHQGEPPGHDSLSRRDSEGRERERAARGGGGPERGRERTLGQIPARRAEG
jgi:HEAT repeat protein